MAERQIRVLALASKAAGLAPGQRYRFEQWAPHLKHDHGISVDLLPFESGRLSKILYERGHFAEKAGLVGYDFLRRASALKAARSYDAILVYREASLIGPAIYERLLAWTGQPLILDFDDAIWSPAQAHLNGLFSRLHFYGKTSTICRIASAVTVGNDYLADYARKRNDQVFVIPSTIELADYPKISEPAQDEAFVVGWTGSASTLPHFETARPALEDLARQIPLKVRVICNRPPDRPIAGAETEFVAWSVEDEAKQVGDCHVGIMPLPDDEVSRGKCGMKALQFMATGRPVVASPVGVNSRIIRNGENGLLASTTDEYVGALMKLASDAGLRRRMGEKARRTIEQEYSAEAASRAFAEVVRSVVR